MMDVFEAIKNRRSIRTFQDKPVPEELIEKIIEAGQWSPSACNRQAWKFIVIDSLEVKLEYRDHLLSSAMAIQNMQLAAYSLGLGSCCVNNLPIKSRLRKILNIPRHYDPISLLCIGFPKSYPKPLKRKEKLDEIVCRDNFNFKDNFPAFDIKLNIKRVIRYIYYRLPLSLKKVLDPFARKFEKRFDQ
jgi:nitroreductase